MTATAVENIQTKEENGKKLERYEGDTLWVEAK